MRATLVHKTMLGIASRTKCKMDIFILGVIVLSLGSVVSAQSSCGTLASRFLGTTARIRFYPDHLLASSNTLMLGRTYRWMRAKDDGGYTDIRMDDRISDVNFTLYVKTFSPLDVGVYYVECQSLTGQLIESARLNVTRPDFTQSSTSSISSTLVHTSSTFAPTSNQSTSVRETTSKATTVQGPIGPLKITDSEGIESGIAIVIVSFCVVIIVTVISGTIVLVCRRRTQQAEDHRRLTEITESSMACRMEGDGESVYNEIDLTYESNLSKNKVKEISGSRQQLSSPILPRRPVTTGQQTEQATEKTATFKVIIRGLDNKENDNANEIAREKRPKADPSLTVDVKSMYASASVVPKRNRINKNAKLPPEYINTKPVLRKHGGENGPGGSTNSERYSVMFPKIDMSTINTNIEVNRSNLVSISDENFDVVCKSGVYRTQKRKSSRNRGLNYIEIEHSSTDNKVVLVDDSVKAPHEKLEYSSIDFEKKAFVAPTRKPPSSWYKRRNKKKRY